METIFSIVQVIYDSRQQTLLFVRSLNATGTGGTCIVQHTQQEVGIELAVRIVVVNIVIVVVNMIIVVVLLFLYCGNIGTLFYESFHL